MSSVALTARRGAGFLAEVDESEDEDDCGGSSAVAGGFEEGSEDPTGDVVFISRRKNEAPNRMKARVTSFHTLILEQRGALKLKWPAKPDLSRWRCVGLTSGSRRGG